MSIASLPLLAAVILGVHAGPLVGTADSGARLPVVLAQAGTAAGGIPLQGTAWLLKSLGGEDVDQEFGSSLEFDTGGAVFGSGGCNRFRGGVEIEEGDRLVFGELASTMMACEEDKAKQEAAFHAAMAATVAFRIEDAELVLLDEAGEAVARLTPAP